MTKKKAKSDLMMLLRKTYPGLKNPSVEWSFPMEVDLFLEVATNQWRDRYFSLVYGIVKGCDAPFEPESALYMALDDLYDEALS